MAVGKCDIVSESALENATDEEDGEKEERWKGMMRGGKQMECF